MCRLTRLCAEPLDDHDSRDFAHFEYRADALRHLSLMRINFMPYSQSLPT